MKTIRIASALLAISIAGLASVHAKDPLPAWRDGMAKEAIVKFVEKVTKGWTVVSMKDDWKTIFPSEKK